MNGSILQTPDIFVLLPKLMNERFSDAKVTGDENM